jgi:hypothetical protein
LRLLPLLGASFTMNLDLVIAAAVLVLVLRSTPSSTFNGSTQTKDQIVRSLM